MQTFPIIQRPDPARQGPVVVSSPHSGREIPEQERGLYARSPEELAHDGDLYVDELYDGAAELGATFITTPYSRFVIDLNRLPDDVSPRSVAGARMRRAPGYYGDRGIIWAHDTHGEPIYERPLPEEDFLRRRSLYYEPYHAALTSELERLRAEFGFAILLDAHSMPSRAARMHPDPGKRRPDVVPGDLHGVGCGRWLSRLTTSFWRASGFAVQPNTPYKGGGIVRLHGRPTDGIHAIQLELNRALYMDERTLERHDGLSRLREHCLRFVDTLLRFEPDLPSRGPSG